ncbi:type II toxin-antitoxin system RelB/DinJ family antitoxin [Megasphaera hominis]|jgi:DNA-damage-inducible protein J|uniref:Type II toxin-antitoxin system RelB/DinJ family antitoxin n=1 Tax=Megasphaera hominis TaxID=159836 RepID=A0ABR6VN56_9FIRM|nr:type II toxin-antitoxin system RelB/DinJ family antitoxin [Megasphaera hominis]MBC3537996.1 type II toxin-antitoxin system RelB/DinJ family antitoxin [Megasphaera hominis]
MSDTKTLNLRVDAELKRQAETIFADLGIPTSTAINMFLRSVVRYGGIPFDLRISPSELETIRAIDDVNHDRNMSKTYDSVAEVMDDLD